MDNYKILNNHIWLFIGRIVYVSLFDSFSIKHPFPNWQFFRLESIFIIHLGPIMQSKILQFSSTTTFSIRIEFVISAFFPIMHPLLTVDLRIFTPFYITVFVPIAHPLKEFISFSSNGWLYLFGIRISFCLFPLINESMLSCSNVFKLTAWRMYSFWSANLAKIFKGFW